MGCTHSRPTTSSPHPSSSTIELSERAQKHIAKEAARRDELKKQEALLSGGITVGKTHNPQYRVKQEGIVAGRGGGGAGVR